MLPSRPDLDSLACFVAAAKTLNFRAAARTQALTAAAFGKRIQRLEEDLGVVLFHRSTRLVELSEAGHALLAHAQRVLELAEACAHVAQQTEGPPPLELTLGTRHELGMSWVLPARRALLDALPHLTIHIAFGSAEDMERRLIGLTLDAAISSKAPSTASIDGLPIHREGYVFIASPTLLAARPLTCPADARAHTLIDIDDSLPLASYCEEGLRGRGRLRFERFLYMGTIAAIRALVLAGEGVAVIPEYFVREELARGELVAVLPEVRMQHDMFRLLFRADTAHRALMEDLAARLAELPLR